MMVKARKYVVRKHFQGLPKRFDYEVVEYELPPLEDGEILVKAEWISVDPYLRAFNRHTPVPYDQFGYQIGLVVESRNPKYPKNCRVVSHKGWCDYVIIEKNVLEAETEAYKLPDLQGLPDVLGIDAIGMVGATAYFGFLHICKPKAGETVVVTGAAGAVGTLVGQIAKIKGCKVIGIAGSDAKVKFLEDELGFDKAINYKTEDINSALKEAAPKGVDCYFDNVGGEISSIVMGQMNDFGRVSVCGSISSYNEDPRQMPQATIIQPSLVFKQIRVEGFLAGRWAKPINHWPAAFEELLNWVKKGDIKTKYHITVGFDKLFDAFVGMLNGENLGKSVVKV
ncbi:prostaglandin reductase 1-like isoform X1 [Aricia agestis]|uniref:prostaglandin reductase 1-like isoform X1 n=2 Tax=Aricia agestis TaxID=91739 RepID=UPI001C201C87|nr:prostaglandin reductase 1-like isoform X1 [Aricia agestis]